jgi:maltose alpha-D-glucosyltransferase/alpha-amylase
LMAGPGRNLLETALPVWLPRQRWFGAKTRKIQSVRVLDWVDLPAASPASVPDADRSDGKTVAPALFFVEVAYSDGPADTYQLPLAFSNAAAADGLTSNNPLAILATFTTPTGAAVLHDATTREDFRQALLALIERNATLSFSTANAAAAEVSASPTSDDPHANNQPPSTGDSGVLPVAPVPINAQPGEAATPPRTEPATAPSAGAQSLPRESPAAGDTPGLDRLEARSSTAFSNTHASQNLLARVGSAEQSNTSIIYGKQFILKLFRRLQPGDNPDVEIGRFLTEVAHFPRIAPFLGEIAVTSASGEKTTVAMLQGLVANQGDGWQWFLEQLAGFFAAVAALPPPPQAPAPSFLSHGKLRSEAREHAQATLQAAALLGRRTAEMHMALATPTSDSAFAPEPFTSEDLNRDAQRIDAQITSTLEALKIKLSSLKDLTADDAALLLSRRIDLFARANAITASTAAGQRIRIHGDYHLGQTLRTGESSLEPGRELRTETGDFVLIDFEGEPARLLAERRQKQSPLKDVAGMIRSLSYAAYSGLDRFLADNPKRTRTPGSDSLTAWAIFWQNSASSEFLRSYRETVAANPALLPSTQQSESLLGAYLLEKALYELLYELNNRPLWLRIPLAGILSL